ncbi:hypothetical protein C2G38_2156680 [Gigaspora rosea]|uniref:HCP-like protein n=1 Tax=Gigaspora rosea TaxID=44941 RepID=A0A397W4E8_9GLOM|nr:hypothetical protein C2G38_2156680 [Gigaspora rosea]
MSNNLTAGYPEKIISLPNETTQITDNFNQLYLKNNNSFNEIVKELYNKYNEELLICQNMNSVINSLDQILANKKQNPESIISWCMDNQSNPMVQIVLARCYRFGKWIEKDEHKAFIYYQKSADMEFVEGIYGVGVCYGKGIGVDKDEHKTFIHYQKAAYMGHIKGANKTAYCYERGV